MITLLTMQADVNGCQGIFSLHTGKVKRIKSRQPTLFALESHSTRTQMIQSMTGYAAISRETAQGSLFIELKSVNNRFLDVQFRVIEELRALEPSLRELAAARIGRGSVP